MGLWPEQLAVVGDRELGILDSMSTPPEAEEAEPTMGSNAQDMGPDGGTQGWEGKVEDVGMGGGASFWGAERKLKKNELTCSVSLFKGNLMTTACFRQFTAASSLAYDAFRVSYTIIL